MAKLVNAVHMATRVNEETETKIDRVRARLGLKRVDLLRMYLEEIPDDYVPRRFAPPTKRKGA